MHQSIPAVPIPPPRATAGHLLALSVPGVGHWQFYRSPGGGTFAVLSCPGGWAFAYPGATPGHLTRVFESAMDEFSGKDEAFVEQWLVRQGLQKPVDVFKGMFSQFCLFLHSLEKYKGINIIRSN